MASSKNRETVELGVSIFKRGKKGIYQADYHHHGQHRRKSLKTTNKKVAVQRARALAMQLQTPGLDPVHPLQREAVIKPTTLKAASEAYVAFKRASGNQPKSYGKDKGTLQYFTEFAASEGVTKVDQVNLVLIDMFRQHRGQQTHRGKRIGQTQLYHDAALLKRFFNWCTAREMMARNPMETEKVKRPPQRRRDKCTPTLDQVDTILKALPPRIYGPAAVLTFTGMRSANCRQLRVEDVDLAGGWVHVRSLEGARTKCGNEWKVPIHPRLAQVFRSLVLPKSGYVFTASPSRKYPRGGHWINMKHLNDEFVAILKTIGMPAGREDGFTISSLRHFFKSFCVAHGVPREYLDAWQGHKSIATASDLYVHTFDADSQRLIRNVPFGNGSPAADAG